MSSKITTPYPLFNDIDGRPLDAGYIYIGEAGKNPEVYPIPVFWDEALTVPAEQPIRTRNGFFAKNGRAGKIFVSNADCSITFKNKKKVVVSTDLFADLFFGQKDVVKTVESIGDLQNLVRWEGRTVYVKGYYKPKILALTQPYKGGGYFTFITTRKNENDHGHCINGWVRADTNNEYRVVNFGAQGDWNQNTQTGANDQIAIQRCTDACLSQQRNMRNGGARSIVFDTGAYYFERWDIHRVDWFSLMVRGEGDVALWIKGVGNKDGGIINNLEGTTWKNITFNGFDGSSDVYPPIFGANDLQYVMQCFLPAPYSLPDIDIIFDECRVFWCKEFALIRGRGFTFRNGDWGGIQGALCVIDCDPSLIFETSNTSKANQWFDTGMRHYRVQNSRGDGSQFVVRVQGAALCKEYIHDIVISDCAIVNNEYGIVDAEDARLISPKIIDNFFTMCTRGFHCKSVINALETGNTWSNNAGMDSSHYNPSIIKNGIAHLHIFSESIDGFELGFGSSYKQIVSSLIYIAQTYEAQVKDITISNAFFEDFGDAISATACLIRFENNPVVFKNLRIAGNNIKSKNGQIKKWTSHPVDLDYINTNNTTDGKFQDSEFVWSRASATSGITYNYKYIQDGDYIAGIVIINIASTVTSGPIGNIPLPVPPIPLNPALSSQISSVATFGLFDNLKTSKFLSANISVSNGITLSNVTDAANLDVSHLTKLNTSNVSTISLSYRYRFKM